MGKLNAADRKALPKTSFAVPSKATTAQGKATPGSYPIPDRGHAINALARSSGKAVAGQVRAAVAKKFPGLGRVAGKKARRQEAAKAVNPPKRY